MSVKTKFLSIGLAGSLGSTFFIIACQGHRTEIARGSLLGARIGNGCALGEPTLMPILLDGLAVYVNPQAAASQGGELFLGGFPNYLWPDSALRTDPADNTLLGVTVDRSGATSPIPLPIPDPIDFPVVVAAPGLGWLVAFEEVEGATIGQSRRTKALWTGIWNGRGWSDLKKVPVPHGYSISRIRSRQVALSASDEGIRLATIVDPRNQLLLFEYVHGQWFSADFPPDHGPATISHVGRVVFGTTRDGLPALVFIQSNIARNQAGTTLRVLSQSRAGWKESDLYTWLGDRHTSGFGGRFDGDFGSFLIQEPYPTLYLGPADRELTRVQLDSISEAYDSHMVLFPDQNPGVIAQSRSFGGETPSLLVHHLTRNGGHSSSSIPSPFRVLQAANVVDQHLLLVGMLQPPDESGGGPSTGVARFPIQCESPLGGD